MEKLLNFKPDAYSCEYAIGHKFYTIMKGDKTVYVSQYPDECCANFWIGKNRVNRPLFEGTIEECANEANKFITEH